MLRAVSQHWAHSQYSSSAGFHHLIHPILLLMNSQLQGDMGRRARHHQERVKHELGAMMLASWA